jgi:hypothetical protein
VKSEPVKIQVATLRVILEKLCGSETIKERMKELYANDMLKLKALPRGRLQITIPATGEIIEIGK